MTESLSGAEFMRQVGDDPGKWAQRFLDAYASTVEIRSDDDRLEFVTGWFSDFADAVRKAKPKPIVE